MKKTIVLACLLAQPGWLYFTAAQAEGRDSYIGIQMGSANSTFDGISSDVDLDFLMLRLGVWVADDTSLELRMGKGRGHDSIGAQDLSFESNGGMYLSYYWNLGNHASVYGIAGGSAASVKFSENNGSNQDEYYSLSYGAGLKISVLCVEYMHFLDTSQVEADTLSVGLQYAFE
jgi:opacity protein-like surface antigen